MQQVIRFLAVMSASQRQPLTTPSLPYFHLKDKDPGSQQTRTAMSAPLTAAMLIICVVTGDTDQLVSLVRSHTKTSQT